MPTYKKVSLHLHPSRSAYLVQVLFLILLMWAILVSGIPLVPSLYLMMLVINTFSVVSVDSYVGKLKISASGEIWQESKQGWLKSAFTLYKPLMIQITTEQGVKINIWRDACSESYYRQLLVLVRFISDKKEG